MSGGVVCYKQQEPLKMSCQRFSLIFLLLCYLHISLSDSEVDLKTLLEGGSSPQQETWTGTWFPHSTTVKPYQHNKKDSRVPMGVSNPDCDDAQSRLDVDWDGGPFEYTCYQAQKFVPQNIEPILSMDNIPEEYSAPHSCMNETIPYDGIPTFGTHRPLWPRWGEYLYVPPQRWLHNLEHGGVVMLYHPCSDPVQRNRLRDLVKGCMYRYVITPSKLTSPERPLALVTWGKLLTLSMVEPRVVTDFIKTHALRGPEKTSRDGQYNYHLKLPSAVVPGSDINDSELCPDLKRP